MATNIQKRKLKATLLTGGASRDDRYIVLEKLEPFKLAIDIWLEYSHNTVMHQYIDT